MNKHIKEIIPLWALRTGIGWLFFHEGVHKLLTEGWTSKMYLSQSTGPLHGLFAWIAGNESLLQFADYGITISLMLIGACLLSGLFERISALAGIVLLITFYLAYPPIGDAVSQHNEGSYMLVDKNLILAIALWVVWKFNCAKDVGLDHLFRNRGKNN